MTVGADMAANVINADWQWDSLTTPIFGVYTGKARVSVLGLNPSSGTRDSGGLSVPVLWDKSLVGLNKLGAGHLPKVISQQWS